MKIIRFLGSRGLSMTLIVAVLVYFLWLAVLWVFNLRPAPYMLWFLLSILSVPFLANLVVNLLTRRYVYYGNIVFHAAFVIILAGLWITLSMHFAGRFTLIEGESFFGEEAEYEGFVASGPFIETAPSVSMRLDEVKAEFWEDKLHFTALEAFVKYPATTLADTGLIRVNGGLKMDGANLRLTGFGYAPEFLIEDTKSGRITRQTRIMGVFPPGSEDYVELGGYRVYLRVLPDPVAGGDKLRNRSMNLVEPAFLVRVEWLYDTIFEGALRTGEAARFGPFSLKITGIKNWASFEAVKDPGVPVLLTGFAVMLLGLAMRLLPALKRSNAA